MGGVERRPPGAVVPTSGHAEADGTWATPMEYTVDGSQFASMEWALTELPPRLRSAVWGYVDLDRLPPNRWHVEQRSGLFTIFVLGDGCAVLASQDNEAKPIRRVFSFEPSSLLKLGPQTHPPTPPRGAGSHPTGGAAQIPDDAHPSWAMVFGQLPPAAQRLFEDALPPSKPATRYVGSCLDGNHDRERLWIFGGRRHEVVLMFAERRVPADPASPRGTDKRRRVAPWTVTAWRGGSPGSGSELSSRS